MTGQTTKTEPNLSARFWAKVDFDAPDGCWVWTGTRHTFGYGQIIIDGSVRLAHRVAYQLTRGAIPDGRVVRHRCDNPPCVRPDHIELGTQTENMRDMWTRGRGSRPPVHRGERHPRAKLTADQVAEIRDLYRSRSLSQYQLADRYGVSQPLIGAIVRGVIWRDLA